MVISRVYESIHKALALNLCVRVCMCVCICTHTLRTVSTDKFCALKILLLIIIINTYVYI